MIKLTNILLEKQGDKYEYGCVMLKVSKPPPFLYDYINPKDLYEEVGDRSYGIEDEPHITLLYGLHPKISKKEIESILDSFTFTTVKMMKPSLFKNEKYDVVKCDIISGELHKINSELKKLPHTSNFPNYHPHITICYMKAGLGDGFIKNFSTMDPQWLSPKYAIYSEVNLDGDKTEHIIHINID
jgi:hypothetical protein